MAKQSFSVGQVLTANQMLSLQQTAMLGGSATAKTASYTLVAADAGTVVSVNSTSATTITVNTGLFSAGDTVTIQNWGSGLVTITAGTATVNTAGSLIVPQYDGGVLYFTSASAAIYFDFVQAGAVSPLTTKGDLYGYGSSDARIPIGADNTVLTADSGETLGLKWATPASGGMTLISTTALSGTTVTISSIPSTYTNLQIVIAGANAASAFTFTIKPNNTSPDTLAYLLYRGSTFASVSRSDFDGYGDLTGVKNAFVLNIYDYASARYKNAFMSAVHPTASGDARILGNGGYLTTDVISSVTITSSVSLTAGTCLIYGVK
jgi:hypothetical protein